MTNQDASNGDNATSAEDSGKIIQHALAVCDVAELKLIEMLYFAYRDFVHEPDEILQRDNFGRSHHRILHFINRHPGLSVADLLEILKITKQSLAPSLRQLIDKGYVQQQTGAADRRKRLLYPTLKGRELMLALCAPQSKRMVEALSTMNEGDRQVVLTFLTGIVRDEDQKLVQHLTDK